ncbi:MAG: cytochrome c3 family protein [Chloroflexota bacterium]|nr:cytochrome c3 family protein [Chloroflexota bacterium]
MANRRRIVILGSVFGGGSLIVLGLLVYFVGSAWFGLPVGADGPEQPIAFPHTVHAGAVEDGGIGLSCTFCHRNVDKGAAATVPSVQQCMFCHSQVVGTSTNAQAEIQKLRTAAEHNEPVAWIRVHRVPDHVQFVHDAHIRAGFTCSTCHGDVAKMTKVKQVRALKMGDCVDCHRENNGPTNCSVCHY